jgi:regulator of sigma E protease
MFPILVFVLILGLLVFVHELGHFAMARKFGVRCDEFGLGFVPRICGVQKNGKGKYVFFWRKNAPLEEKVLDPETGKDVYINKGNTIYSLNLFPIGGFVKIKGEMGENPDDKDSFAHKPAGQRSLILVAGVAMNVLLCVVLISLGLMIGFPQVISDEMPASARIRDEKIQFASIYEGSPAITAGLKQGDIILSIDGNKFKSEAEVQNYLSSKPNQEVEVQVERSAGMNTFRAFEKKELVENTETGVITKKVVLATKKDLLKIEGDTAQEGALGVALVKTGLVQYSWYESIWRGFQMTGDLLKEIVVAFYGLLKNLIIEHKTSADIAGPVGIAVLTKGMVQLGFVHVLQFAALLSVNLAIINILPIPALDGGRLLFILIEKIRRKTFNQELELKLNTIFFVVLLVLIAMVTYKDVMRFIVK